MRPDSIRKFDMFYLAAIAIGLASSLMNYDSQLEAAAGQLSQAGLQDQAGTVMMVTLGLILGFNLLLWFLASKLRIGFVKWIILLIVVISVASRLMGIAQGANVSITDLISVFLKAISVFFLFRSDASEWFAARSA